MRYVLISTRRGYIHAVPLTSKTGLQQTRAHAETHEFWTRKGLKPTLARFDNESSKELEDFYAQAGIPIQFFPPSDHRANRAERAIQSFKNHFVATLATCDPKFPLLDWDLLLPQAELTVNLLRASTADPTVSAWEHVHGHPYDYDAHPFVHAGCKVVVHESPDTRGSWAAHGHVGFYIGPAAGHYRCFRAWMPHTHHVRISGTIAWFPKDLVIPGNSVMEHFTAAASDLISSIQ
ncbi:hypothetical protein B484DRAFT_339767, partial [Ochromonadaceae sp. CCMP2298]